MSIRAWPLVEWQGVAYSVSPEALGYKVTCRVEVGSQILEIHLGTRLVGRHELRRGATEPVFDPAHLAACEAIALGRTRPQLTLITGNGTVPAATSARLDLGEGDYEVEVPDLAARYGGCECSGQLP